MDLIERATRFAGASKPAVSGSNGSGTTYALACALIHGFCLAEEQAYAVMWDAWNPSCLPPWPENQLRRKVREAARRGGPPPGKRPGWLLGDKPAPSISARPAERVETGWETSPTPIKHTFNVERLRQFRNTEAIRQEWWQQRSPVRRPQDLRPTQILDATFERGDRVLVFDRADCQGTWLYVVGRGWYKLGRRPGQKSEEMSEPVLRSEKGIYFMTNPVTGTWICLSCRYEHKAGDGILETRACPQCAAPDLKTAVATDQVMSRRSGHNITAYRHLVLEHDPPEGASPMEHAQMWAGFVAQLPLPLVSFTVSGGDSIHALIKLHSSCERGWNDRRDVIGKYLVQCGADPAAMRAVQLTRLGNCMRGPNRQHLLYLDPDPDYYRSVLERDLEFSR